MGRITKVEYGLKTVITDGTVYREVPIDELDPILINGRKCNRISVPFESKTLLFEENGRPTRSGSFILYRKSREGEFPPEIREFFPGRDFLLEERYPSNGTGEIPSEQALLVFDTASGEEMEYHFRRRG